MDSSDEDEMEGVEDLLVMSKKIMLYLIMAATVCAVLIISLSFYEPRVCSGMMPSCLAYVKGGFNGIVSLIKKSFLVFVHVYVIFGPPLH